MHLDAYDRIRERIARDGLDPDRETLIALFVCATKAVNLPHLAVAGMSAPAGPVALALTSQLFRESEAMTLLMRSTRWSPDLRVYWANMSIVAPLYAEFARCGISPAALVSPQSNLDAMALAHAVLTTVRLSPILPEGALERDGFAGTLTQIDRENERLLQAQVHLLKAGFAHVPLHEREKVLAQKNQLLDGLFTSFLETLEAGCP